MILEFDINGFEDLCYWVENDRKKAKKIMTLIGEIQKSPFTGTGKPEPLKHILSKCWSRRIDHEHRLVYAVEDKKIRVLSCRYHY